MNETIQYILAGIIVAAAVFAAVRTVIRTLRHRRTALTACAGCRLQEYCNKPEKFSVKKCDDKVAQTKNLS